MEKHGLPPETVAALNQILTTIKPGADFTKVSLPELKELIRIRKEFFDYVDNSVEKAFMVTDNIRIEGKNVIDVGENQMKIFNNAQQLFEYYWKHKKDHGLFQ